MSTNTCLTARRAVRLAFAAFLAALLTGLGTVTQSQAQTAIPEPREPAVWILGVHGVTVPSFPLAGEDLAGAVDVTYRVEAGPATFVGGVTAMTLTLPAGQPLVVPEILPGPQGADSRIRTDIVGQPDSGPDLLVSSILPGQQWFLPAGHPAYRVVGGAFVAIDMAQLPQEADFHDIHLSDQSVLPATCSEGPILAPGANGPGDIWLKRRAGEALPDGLLAAGDVPPFRFKYDGACIKKPTVEGRVKWKIDDPSGQGYQIKHPKENRLLAPGSKDQEQRADGLYNCGRWGCWVVKVPGHCKLTVKPDKLECCCNWWGNWRWGTCRLANTKTGKVVTESGEETDESIKRDWPDCPGCS